MSHPILAAALLAASLLGACSRTDEERLQDVRRYFEQQELSAATIELKNLLQDNPSLHEARFELGKALLLAGDHAGAELELRRALEGGYNRQRTIPLLATVLVAAGKYKELLAEFATTDLEQPEAAAELKLQVARVQLSTGEVDKGQATLEAALARANDYQPAIEALARVFAARGQHERALQMVTELVKRRPDSADAWALQGDVLAQAGKGRREEAIEAYRKALKQAPDLSRAHAGLVALQLEAGNDEAAREQVSAMTALLPNSPQTRFFRAVLALRDGKVDRARELARRLTDDSPANPRFLLLAAQAELQAGQLLQAETLLARSIALVPSAPLPRRLLADVYLQAGQPSKALNVLAPLLGAASKDADATLLAGQAHLMAGRVDEADAAFGRASGLRVSHPGAATGRALVQLSRGQGEAAIDALESVTRTDASGSADLPLISQLMKRKDYVKAMVAVERYAAKFPRSALPDSLRAQVLFAKGDHTGARRSLEEALAKDSANLTILNALSELDLADGKADAALARLRSLVDREPKNVVAKVVLADFVGRTGGRKEEVVDIMRQAIVMAPRDDSIRAKLIDFALGAGDGALALTIAQEAESALPQSPLILDRLGLAYQVTGQVQQAVDAFQKLASIQKSSPAPQLRLVDAHLAARNFNAARTHSRAAIEMAPESVLVHRTAVLVALRSGQPADAAASVAALKQRQGSEAVGWQLEGEVALAERHAERAMTAFRKSLSLRPSSEVARLLHLALTGAGKGAEAEQHAQAWVKAHPGDNAFLLHLGEMALRQEKLPQAEDWFRQILRRQPNNLEALNNTAYVLALQKKPEAVALAERVVKLAPNRPPLMDTLAMSYAAAGRIREAVELQERVVGSAPDQPEFRLTLARLQLQAGDVDQARQNLLKVSKYGSEFARQAEVDRMLKSMPR